MIFPVVDSGIRYAWASTGLVWLIGLASTKRTVRVQSVGPRLFNISLAFLGFCLMGPWLRYGWLKMRFVPDLNGVQIAGLAITIAGCLFAIWARFTLGGNWSGRATVKADHELIVRGPYAVARHPIYTGLLLALAGTALAIGEWRSILALLAVTFALMVKMSQEERLMMQTFPEAYPLYRQRVKALIPGVM